MVKRTPCKQCIAKTKNGTGPQCKLNSCKYSPYCWHHTSLGIAASTLGPDSGDGVFAKKDIPANTKIADYKVGNIPLTNAQLNALYPGDTLATHAWRKNQNLTYDAAKTNSVAGKFNNCRPRDKRAGRCPGNNAGINQEGNLVTKKRIQRGEEIFVSGYGPDYWRGR
jgi:hypothetical protein